MTAILALAVAVLPAVGGAVAAARAVEAVQTVSVEVCCEHSGIPCDSADRDHGTKSDCASMAVCAVNCFNYTGMAEPGASYAPMMGTPMTAAVMATAMPHSDPPPSPPPRV